MISLMLERMKKGLIVLVVFGANHVYVAQVGTDCPKEAKNIAEILVIMENTKCFYMQVFITFLVLPTNQKTVSNS